MNLNCPNNYYSKHYHAKNIYPVIHVQYMFKHDVCFFCKDSRASTCEVNNRRMAVNDMTSEMASLSNSRWPSSKERPNRSTNNGYLAETANRYVGCGVSDTLVREKLSF